MSLHTRVPPTSSPPPLPFRSTCPVLKSRTLARSATERATEPNIKANSSSPAPQGTQPPRHKAGHPRRCSPPLPLFAARHRVIVEGYLALVNAPWGRPTGAESPAPSASSALPAARRPGALAIVALRPAARILGALGMLGSGRAAASQVAKMASDAGLPRSVSPALSFEVSDPDPAPPQPRGRRLPPPPPGRSPPPPALTAPSPLPLQVVAQQGRARSSRMTLPHYTAQTPMFMPVGTQGGRPHAAAIAPRAAPAAGCTQPMRHTPRQQAHPLPQPCPLQAASRG
jgi:hypothetical protein